VPGGIDFVGMDVASISVTQASLYWLVGDYLACRNGFIMGSSKDSGFTCPRESTITVFTTSVCSKSFPYEDILTLYINYEHTVRWWKMGILLKEGNGSLTSNLYLSFSAMKMCLHT
jgi:hypothetical protein